MHQVGGRWVAKLGRGRWAAILVGRWVTKLLGRWVAKLVEHLLATAALWVQLQTSVKNTKWAKERPTHSSLDRQNIQNVCITGTEKGLNSINYAFNNLYTLPTCLKED